MQNFEDKQEQQEVLGNSNNPTQESQNIEEKEVLEIGLLLDCTSSMKQWLIRAQQTLKQIVDEAVESCDGLLTVKVCFIGYRDHKCESRFEIKHFTSNIQDIKQFISSVKATSKAFAKDQKNDPPEDVTGGMRRCLDEAWSEYSSKQVFHIFDMPCHGSQYHNIENDDYPKGCPEGLVLEDLIQEFKNKNIGYTVIKVNNFCNKMINIMKNVYPDMQISDLSKYTKEEEIVNTFKLEVKTHLFSQMHDQQLKNSSIGKGSMVLNQQAIKFLSERKNFNSLNNDQKLKDSYIIQKFKEIKNKLNSQKIIENKELQLFQQQQQNNEIQVNIKSGEPQPQDQIQIQQDSDDKQ